MKQKFFAFFAPVVEFFRPIARSYKNLRNWLKIKDCRALDHAAGAHILVEQTPSGPWEPPKGTCENWIRPVSGQYKCEACGTIFTRKTWEYSLTTSNNYPLGE